MLNVHSDDSSTKDDDEELLDDEIYWEKEISFGYIIPKKNYAKI